MPKNFTTMAQRSMAGIRRRTAERMAGVQANRRPNLDVPAANLAGTRGDETARRRAAQGRAAQAQTERQQRQQQLVGMDTRRQKLLYNPTTNQYRAVPRGMTVPRGYQNVSGGGQLSVARSGAGAGATGTYRSGKVRY